MYKIYGLKCNNISEPLGLDSDTMTFSWRLKSDKQDTCQVTYRLIIREHENIIYDSKETESAAVYGITVSSKILESAAVYYWSVQSRNNYGEIVKSQEAMFMTGQFEKEAFRAMWIGSGRKRRPIKDSTDAQAMFSGQLKSLAKPEEVLDAPIYLRKSFVLKKPVKKAIAYATAAGIYELNINGKAVNNLLAPEYTSYAKHLEYQTYEVSELLTMGKQAIGIILADGWHTGKIGLMGIGNQYGEMNAAFLQLEVEYYDGTYDQVVTDESWLWNYGGYIYADIFVGEYFDENRELSDFSLADYDDGKWHTVAVYDYGYAHLSGQSVAPIAVEKEIKPRLLLSAEGEWILDAGENIVGFTKFSLEAEAGCEIALEHSEMLSQEGNFLQNIMGQHKNQKDRFICSYTGRHEYQPKFTFHGFRYVKITGLEAPVERDFTIVVIASKLEKSGTFICSNAKINQLQENIFRSQQGNMIAIPTDCPQRERAGWTGDMQIYASTATFNMDIEAFLGRWLHDMRLEQRPDGQIPNVVPLIDSDKYINQHREDNEQISSAGWADACIIIPYQLYKAYGNLQILEDNYIMMTRWMDYVESRLEDSGLWIKGFHFGDWLIPSIMQELHDPMQTALKTKQEVAAAMVAYSSLLMTEIAMVLNDQPSAERYRQLNNKVRQAFDAAFVDDDGRLSKPLQGLYILALHFDLIGARKRSKSITHLTDLIHQADDCLDTGFLSIPFLLDTLCEIGETKLAYRLLYQEKTPSWLYALRFGATTIWENWVAILPDGTRTSSSYNHFAFGCVGDFIYRHLGGLYELKPGYQKVLIAPDFDNGLTWARTEYESRFGMVKIFWQKQSEQNYLLEVELPPNTNGVIKWGRMEREITNGHYLFDCSTPKSENHANVILRL